MQCKCSNCGSDMVVEIQAHPYEVTFEHVTYTAPRVASRCDDCGWSWIAGVQLDRNHDAYVSLVNSIDGYFSPDNVLTLREIYEISHEDAAALFNIPEGQYIMYEHGEEEVPRELGARMRAAMDNNEQVADALVEIWRKRRQA